MVLGQEKYVLIESVKNFGREDIFLDKDNSDLATENFFKSQGGKIPKYKRSYFDDCYGIIDGVALGMGKAVMPEHLVSENGKIKITKGFKPYKLDVVLHYYHQSFYSKLHQSVIEQLTTSSKSFL